MSRGFYCNSACGNIASVLNIHGNDSCHCSLTIVVLVMPSSTALVRSSSSHLFLLSTFTAVWPSLQSSNPSVMNFLNTVLFQLFLICCSLLIVWNLSIAIFDHRCPYSLYAFHSVMSSSNVHGLWLIAVLRKFTHSVPQSFIAIVLPDVLPALLLVRTDGDDVDVDADAGAGAAAGGGGWGSSAFGFALEVVGRPAM